MTKVTIEEYQKLVDCKNKEINLLEFKLENFESLQRCKCCECERDAIQSLSDLHLRLLPFEDEYFKGLETKTIAELAKKSIRLTEENSKLEQILEDIKEIAKENIRKCSFSWECEECCIGCWSDEIMKKCEGENANSN